jgi:hypothetical protein
LLKVGLMLTLSSRWYLAEMLGDSAEQGLPFPNKHLAQEHCLRPNIDAPDLATVKDFLRFYIATSRPVLTKKPTVDSINTVTEFFLAGFTRVTGTETDAGERSEVYNVSQPTAGMTPK